MNLNEFLESVLDEDKLTTDERNSLSDDDFALPGRRYPIHDEAHARDALTRVSQFGSAEEKSTVKEKIRKRYPNIEISD